MTKRKTVGIFLDEVSQLLNARNWQDKRQQDVIDWLVRSRKKGWDVVFHLPAHQPSRPPGA